MTINEYLESVKNYPCIYNLSKGEDQSKIPFAYFFKVFKTFIFKRKIKYSSSYGDNYLRNAIAKLENKNEENILITISSTEAIFLLMLKIQKEKKKILIFTPTYPLYLETIKYLNIDYQIIDLEDDNFDLNINVLKTKISTNVAYILINTPNNPTGKVYSSDSLKLLFDYSFKNNITVINDYVYCNFNYKESYCFKNDNLIIIKSFSKTYNLTGLRIGYIIANKELIYELGKLQNLLIVNPSTINQNIAYSALKYKKNNLKKKYVKNKMLIEKELNKANIKFLPLEGAFYCFIKVNNDIKFSIELLKQKQIKILPGSLFLNSKYIRISYAVKYNYLQKALKELIIFGKENNYFA